MDVSEHGERHVAYMYLPFGRYCYKLIVDGIWWIDLLEPNVENGNCNIYNVLAI